MLVTQEKAPYLHAFDGIIEANRESVISTFPALTNSTVEVLNMAKLSLPKYRFRINSSPGDKFNRLTYLGGDFVFGTTRFAKFECECGTVKEIIYHKVRYGGIRSCGCLVDEHASRMNASHGATKGHSKSAEYGVWCAMKERCTNPHNRMYPNYGGRGIAVCERWQNFPSFLEDVGMRPSSKHSIDRIDVNGNYEPGNVRWATSTEQMRNTRLTRQVTINGVTKPLHDWAEELGIVSAKTAWNRIRIGWSDVRALTEPVHTEKRNKRCK